MFHALLLALAIFSAVRLYRIASETLRGNERTVFRWKDVINRRSTYVCVLFATGLSGALIMLSLGAIFGKPRSGVPWVMKQFGYSPFANLTNADVSIKPQNWTGRKDEELDLVKGANLEGRDLRNAVAPFAFFAHADLGRSHMEGAHLTFADLRQAYLGGANLTRTDLSLAQLTGANFSDADLTGAFLVNSHIEHADFRSAKGLTKQMILMCWFDWRRAFFDPDILKQLGLPPDHNQKLEQQMEAEKQAKHSLSPFAAEAAPPVPKAKP